MTVTYDADVNRIYHHHDRWEDHRAGMYALVYHGEGDGADLARVLLADETECWAAMEAVVREWPNATEHNLTATGTNRQAWLGQAACCFVHGVPDHVTKMGWHLLTETEQDAANLVADMVIAGWEASRVETLF